MQKCPKAKERHQRGAHKRPFKKGGVQASRPFKSTEIFPMSSDGFLVKFRGGVIRLIVFCFANKAEAQKVGLSEAALRGNFSFKSGNLVLIGMLSFFPNLGIFIESSSNLKNRLIYGENIGEVIVR